jgi:hypothetical protein
MKNVDYLSVVPRFEVEDRHRRKFVRGRVVVDLSSTVDFSPEIDFVGLDLRRMVVVRIVLASVAMAVCLE